MVKLKIIADNKYKYQYYFTLNRFDVWFPHSIRFSMRMAHIVTEVSGFSTYCTFCHDVAPPRTLLDSHYIVNPQQSYSSRWRRIMQGKIKKIIKNKKKGFLLL